MTSSETMILTTIDNRKEQYATQNMVTETGSTYISNSKPKVSHISTPYV